MLKEMINKIKCLVLFIPLMAVLMVVVPVIVLMGLAILTLGGVVFVLTLDLQSRKEVLKL